MAKLSVRYFELPGPALIRPQRHGDARGSFTETWNRADWQCAGLPECDWLQDNEAFSATPGTVRGLHFQTPPFAQAKLVRVVRGAIFDVAVDLRHGSPHYGQSVSARLDAENGEQLLVPRGFAHGYQTLLPNTLVAYKCDGAYKAAAEGGLLWSDPALAIAWPMKDSVQLSQKDTILPLLEDFASPFEFTQ